MALTLARSVDLGPLRFIYGTYAHTEGAAHETYVTEGRVHLVNVNPNTTGTGQSTAVDVRGDLFSVTVSGKLTTVTFQQIAGVTSGTFLIVVALA